MKIKYIVYILSYVVAIIGVLAVAKYVNIVFPLIFILSLLVGYTFDKKNRHPIPRPVLNIIAIISIIILFPKSIDNLVIPLAEIMIILLSIKLLEPKKFRDFMQIYILSIFLLSASALLTIDFLFMIYFILLFFLVVISTVLLTFISEDEEIILDKRFLKRFILKLTVIPILAIPPTIILFALLPRTETPIFNFLNNQGKAKSGFSDTVSLGDVSEIQQSDVPVMRVTMEQIDRSNLYWRGMTLTLFTGKYWLRRYIWDEKVKFPENAPQIRQTIILEPYGNKYLFALDKPRIVTYRNIRVFGDLTIESKNMFFSRIKYQAISVVTPFIYAENVDKDIYLQVPKRISPKIRELAKKLRGKTPEETVSNIYKFFLKNFKYSLKNLPKEDNSLEKFLFKYKYGNCEYFASATAILLRLNGIPSRIVVGYRGGKYNELGKYYLITQADAHSWVEYYLNGKWIRLDTTPAVRRFDSSRTSEEKISSIELFMDTIQYYWINFVINYNLEKQKKLFNKLTDVVKKPVMNFPKISLKKGYLVLALFLILVFMVGYFILKNYILISVEEKYLRKFLNKLKKYNIEKKENEGLEELLAKIKNKDLYEKAKRFVEIYERIVYKDHTLTERDKRELERILREI